MKFNTRKSLRAVVFSVGTSAALLAAVAAQAKDTVELGFMGR